MRFYSRTDPVGWSYHADVFCAKCGDGLPEIDPEGNAKHPIMAWETSGLTWQDDENGTVDYPCGGCGELANEW